MSKDLDVYGIGNAIVDVQFNVTEKELVDIGLEKAGMTLVGAKQQLATLEALSQNAVNTASGGSGANTVIAMAQLGSKVAYGCIVANDGYGRAYLRDMKVLSVEVNNEPIDNENTGSCLVLITPDAERTMSTSLGVSARFAKEHISEALILRSKWLYIEGYLLSSPSGTEAALLAVEYAKAHGTKIAITFSDKFIVENFGEGLRKIVNDADLIFANKTEAISYYATEDLTEIAKLLPFGVVTLSEQGALVCNEGNVVKIKPFPVTAVDDTGAGDMFAGGFLYGLCQGLSLEKSGEIACYLASKVVSQLGPRLKFDLRTILSSEGIL